MRHTATVVTAQTSYPVSLADAKTFCQVTGTTEDDYINDIAIPGAVQYFQTLTGHMTTQATFNQTWDDWPCELELDWAPVASVSFVKYYDANGTLQTMSTADYWTSLKARPPRIVKAYNVSWPDTQLGRPEVIQVQYVAGYASGMEVGIKQAILQLVKLWHVNRSPETHAGGIPKDIPHTLVALMMNYSLRGAR